MRMILTPSIFPPISPLYILNPSPKTKINTPPLKQNACYMMSCVENCFQVGLIENYCKLFVGNFFSIGFR